MDWIRETSKRELGRGIDYETILLEKSEEKEINKNISNGNRKKRKDS